MIVKNTGQLFVLENGVVQSYPNTCTDESALIVSAGDYVAPVLEKTDEELANEAQAYLDSTDYIYLSQKEKGLSDEEVAEKYADIISKRIEQRSIVSAYQDSLTTD